MKSKHRMVIGIFVLLLISCGLVFYQPIKNNQIYQRDLKLTDEANDDINTPDKEKLIKRAKDSLAEYAGIEIDENEYIVNVDIDSINIIQSYQLISNLASINFIDKETNVSVYYIGYDTTTGVIMEFFASQPETSSTVVMKEAELAELAKDYFVKINDVEKDDIQLESALVDNIYRADILLKSDYRRFSLSLNSKNGKIQYYHAKN